MKASGSAVRVACAQLALDVDRPDLNKAACLDAIKRAGDEQAHIVVLPELAHCGYAFRDRDELAAAAEDRDGPTIQAWSAAAQAAGVFVAAGFAERSSSGDVYNSAVLIDPAGPRTYYRKAHLWGHENQLFTPGDVPPAVVETELGRIGLMICYDQDFPEWSRMAALAGADLICAPTNWPLFDRPSGQTPTEIIKAQANAVVNKVAVAVADRTGTERGAEWLGGSIIVDADGFQLTSPQLGGPAFLVATVNVSASRDKSLGPHNDVIADRRTDLYTAPGGHYHSASGGSQ